MVNQEGTMIGQDGPARQDGPAGSWRRGWPARLRGLSPTAKITYAMAALLLAFIAVVSLAGGSQGTSARGLTPAKDFRLPELGHRGQRISLAAYAGQPVIVNFFASWCVPCQRETPLLARFYHARSGRVIVIGIDANDQAGPAMRFIRSAGVSYPVGADPFPAHATTSYGVLALPQTFFLDGGHRIVRRIFGALTQRELAAGVALMDEG
jgi:cytochrome c biogenesis protein CcmG, thiol:disulfide interchange protein DsbE